MGVIQKFEKEKLYLIGKVWKENGDVSRETSEQKQNQKSENVPRETSEKTARKQKNRYIRKNEIEIYMEEKIFYVKHPRRALSAP